MKKVVKKIAILFCLVNLGMFTSSCEKFVEYQTQGSLVPKDVANYRYLLNNTSAYETGIILGDLASDDIALEDASQQTSLNFASYSYYKNTYTWQDDIFPLNTSYENDTDWNLMYARIFRTNTIIGELPSSTGTTSEKAKLRAEALVHRADAYLTLINQYAKPYSATSATDLGVPLLLTQTVSQQLDRANVETVYQQIISDLKQAAPNLPLTQLYNTLPSKPSAYGLLSRTYLYMNNYALAEAYADSALALRFTLNNLASMTDATKHPKRISDPEILLSKIVTYGTSAYSPTAMRMSSDLVALFDANDQRYNFFTVPASRISSTYTGRYFYRELALGENRNIGPSVPEMMLIKAECQARTGQTAQAMNLVNTLRKNRVLATAFVPQEASSANDALVKVINERRREFCFRMLRWWDMRRLKNDPLFQKTITRTFNGVTYTLAPDSKRYVLPIAQYLVKLNPEIIPNP